MRNVFLECGYSEEQIEKKVNDTFEGLFYGEDKVYHESGDDMGYMEDTGNHDARTEGMSYGMMMCVQLDKKEEFDRLWKWARTNMYMEDYAEAGPFTNYFAWSCALDGTKNYRTPAPDGEEFFAMSLFFAAHRWGNGEGIFNYEKEARKILSDCIHKGETPNSGYSMWNPENHLIKFVPDLEISDPSYHLPHFYELFARWANEEDRVFWKKAAESSRAYLHKACHPDTGLCAEYADYDGTPHSGHQKIFGRHDWFYSDAYRTIANIGLDYEWFHADEWQSENADKLQKFFCETVKDHDDGIYLIDGTIVEGKALHPVAIIATNAQASLAAKGKYAKECVKRFWDTPMRTGDRRYYDNCLYMFAVLALSGRYQIW